jgi:hypothetical protein
MDKFGWEEENEAATHDCELSLYYEGCQRGMFANEDAAQCGCGGHGWFLSQVDTWHTCPVHFANQPHPEDDDESSDESLIKAAAESFDSAEPEGPDADDIPF